MSQSKDHYHWQPSFAHDGALPTSGNGVDGLIIADTSSAGSPSYNFVPGENAGAVNMAFDSQAEIQNLCLHMGDNLQFDIDTITEAYFRLKMNQAALDATTQLAFGLTSARNNAIDSITEAALFRVIGADDTTALVLETDDGATDNNDVATGKSLINEYLDFLISFGTGKRDVRFFIDGQPVAIGQTFSMANYAGGLQPFVQLQKTADANVDGVTITNMYVRGRRRQ
ncbi:hypothetical protein KOR42_39420 [Thalassoglobus neptunius]|uniref:Uncharacterized protein n=1 Tax=Thalassoglobus neptunius TaxID=1938619 RepID=A0A5C5WDK4_9PLAN|nr:hypothetical protein [Thalassoglobus neptunius]TWT49026.1 hypothetical protein KOR42_39420 [Thalassoglobus neptunius]